MKANFYSEFRIHNSELKKCRLIQKKCKRCGICCMKNPPALHKQDIEFIKGKKITFSNLITYRTGEPMYDNINNKVISLDREIIKLRTKQGSTECIFYNDKKKECAIYDVRPIECRKLKCWEPEELMAFYEKDRIDRFSLINKHSAIGEIICLHEEKTDLKEFKRIFFAFRETKDPKLKSKLEQMISYDLNVREFIKDKTGATKEMDFFFGRPLTEILSILSDYRYTRAYHCELCS